jgi:beta-N-acetylhexosaminidase
MRALAQGAAQGEQVVAAINAGVDLLLCSADRDALGRIEGALVQAMACGRFEQAALASASERIRSLRAWLGEAGVAPDLSVVGCVAHRALSRELAERSVTLVRRRDPPRACEDPAIMPQPTDLTPADTSSRVARSRARAPNPVRIGRGGSWSTSRRRPTNARPLRARAAGFDAVVVGTIDAIRQPAQFELVEGVASAGRPTIAVALRTPWDVARYPESVAALCTYSIHPDSLEALAAGLAGAIPFAGRLPVAVPGVTPLAPAGPA